MNKSNNLQFDEIDLKAVFATLWAGKFFIIFSIVFAISITSYSLRGTVRVFTVTYKLNPVSGESPMPSLSRYSGLASIAGIQLPSSSNKDYHIYKQLLKSVETSEKILKNKDLIKKLFLSEWNEQLGNFSKGEKDKNSGLLSSLKLFITGSEKRKYIPPNARRLVEYISGKIEISEDSAGILILKSETSKPEDMVSLILEMTDASDSIMRERYKTFSKDPLMFYKQKISSARSREHREALAQLIAKEERKLMLASSSKYFTAEPIMKPTVSLYPTSPNPKMELAISLLLGLIFGIFFVIFLKYIKRK